MFQTRVRTCPGEAGKEQPCSCGSPKKELEGIRDENLGSRDKSQSTGSSSAKQEDKSEPPSLGSSKKERMGIEGWISNKPQAGLGT